MSLLNREQLLKKETLKREKVGIGAKWFIYVRQMTGRERDCFEQSLRTKIKNDKGKTVDWQVNIDDFRAKLVVCTACDDKGALILQPKDFDLLSQNMSAKNLEKIVNKAQELNNITDDDKQELVKN